MKVKISQEIINKMNSLTIEDVQNIGHLLQNKTEGTYKELSQANVTFSTMANLLMEVAKELRNDTVDT